MSNFMSNFTDAEKKLIQDIFTTKEYEEFPKENLYLVLKDLSEREEVIIRLRYGLDDNHPRSFREIGEQFGLSAERMRQIAKKAIKKLRHPTRTKKMYFGETKPLPIELMTFTPETRIEDCDLSSRARNCLMIAGIITLNDLLNQTEDDLRTIKYLGKRAFIEIQTFIAELTKRHIIPFKTLEEDND